ncbi:MAG: hypothetical protein LBV04_03200 [Deferribacteraceae bacterium]|jgi:hypothetical protein|nr:hypothetical protein [Deferribacteraceae bacterium]
MIDRISRTDYALPMYRQTFSNELETHRIYEERNPSATFSNGRVIGSPQYPQTALDYSLTHAVEGTDRIHYMYNNLGEEYKSNTVDPTGTPYAGNNINILV